MGVSCGEERGRRLILVYECIGKGKEEISTYENVELKQSLKLAMKKMRITFPEIQQVSYSYAALNIDNTIQQLNIPDGGVLTIHLKSTF